jgi:hypothetical protein
MATEMATAPIPEAVISLVEVKVALLSMLTSAAAGTSEPLIVTSALDSPTKPAMSLRVLIMTVEVAFKVTFLCR